MADNVDLQEAAQTLLDHFGATLSAGKDEGRRLMADALHERLGMEKGDAKKMVDTLEEARTIRWQEGPAQPNDAPPDEVQPGGATLVPGALGQQTDRVFGAMLGSSGHWQIGGA